LEFYFIGIWKLDEQHKQLIKMINLLLAAPQTTTRSETVSDLLSHMTKYAEEHFATEEELMRKHDYPHLEQHIAQHLAFQEKTADFCSAAMQSVADVPEALLHYLSEWLVEHILMSDMVYKRFFRDFGLVSSR
jgi:hemerythrin